MNIEFNSHSPHWEGIASYKWEYELNLEKKTGFFLEKFDQN